MRRDYVHCARCYKRHAWRCRGEIGKPCRRIGVSVCRRDWSSLNGSRLWRRFLYGTLPKNGAQSIIGV